MKNKYPIYLILLTFDFILVGCGPKSVPQSPLNPQTRSPISDISQIPVSIGDTPPSNPMAIMGTWQLENFTMSSEGNISGRLTLNISGEMYIPVNYQDVLFIQVWGHYIYPPELELSYSAPAGDFIPIRAALSTDNVIVFDFDGKFNIPPLFSRNDEVALDHIYVTIVWYREGWFTKSDTGMYSAEIDFPETGNPPWLGTFLLDQTVSLGGKIDNQVSPKPDYYDWFYVNIVLPTTSAYPMPKIPLTHAPFYTPPYPMPTEKDQ